MSRDSPARAGRAIGAISVGFFGALWLVAWCLQTYGPEPSILVLIACCALGIFLAGLHQFRRDRRARTATNDPGPGARLPRAFHVVNAAQWITIALAAGLLVRVGRAEWIQASVILIVGLHFLPLARVFGNRQYYFTGAAMILFALAYPLVAAAGPASPIGSLGSGVILWVSAVADLTR